jgi:hypothetical protein
LITVQALNTKIKFEIYGIMRRKSMGEYTAQEAIGKSYFNPL